MWKIGTMMAGPDSQIAMHNQTSPTVASFVSPRSEGNVALRERAFRWFSPWTQRSNLGFRNRVLSVLPCPYTWQAVQHWRKGSREMPARAARAIANYIEATVLEGLAIATELRAHADQQDARPKRMEGCCAIRKDGCDRRGSWRR
jgi:hypothetical protein